MSLFDLRLSKNVVPQNQVIFHRFLRCNVFLVKLLVVLGMTEQYSPCLGIHQTTNPESQTAVAASLWFAPAFWLPAVKVTNSENQDLQRDEIWQNKQIFANHCGPVPGYLSKKTVHGGLNWESEPSFSVAIRSWPLVHASQTALQCGHETSMNLAPRTLFGNHALVKFQHEFLEQVSASGESTGSSASCVA